MRQFLMKHDFITLAIVKGVSENGETVDVQPMVHGFTGAGEKIEQSDIHEIPVWRLQRGNSSIKMRPVIGDIGIIVIADRDISAVKEAKTPNLPNSNRAHSYADAIYLGGVLNQEPTQYIDFSDIGLIVTAPNGLIINGNVTVNGMISLSGDVVAAGISLDGHLHGGVESGGSTTSSPE